MSKLKAIFIAICIIFLYYIIRPISAFFEALLQSRLMHLGFFCEVFMLKWEEYEDVENYINYVKELWNGA